MSDLKMVDDFAPVASNGAIGSGRDGEAMTTNNIKIRFKKGAVFFVAGGQSPGSCSKATKKLAIRLSPGGASKRKADEDVDAEIADYAVKRVKTGEAAIDNMTEPGDSQDQTINNRAFSPAYSMATNTTVTIQTTPSPKKGPIQAVSIYRKLARKLADQPLLLDDLKAYRAALMVQRRNDSKNIASLRTALSAATKDTAMKEVRFAEELRAMQDMTEFWTDSCNKECERAELIKGRMRGFVDEVEALVKAEVVSEASAGSAKDRHIVLELQKIVTRMKGKVRGVGVEEGKQRMEGPADDREN